MPPKLVIIRRCLIIVESSRKRKSRKVMKDTRPIPAIVERRSEYINDTIVMGIISLYNRFMPFHYFFMLIILKFNASRAQWFHCRIIVLNNIWTSKPYLLQASHEGSAGDPEQLSKLPRAAGLGEREAAGGSSAGGSSGSEEDPAVHAAVQNQVSIPVCVYVYVCVCVQCCIFCCNNVHAH